MKSKILIALIVTITFLSCDVSSSTNSNSSSTPSNGSSGTTQTNTGYTDEKLTLNIDISRTTSPNGHFYRTEYYYEVEVKIFHKTYDSDGTWISSIFYDNLETSSVTFNNEAFYGDGKVPYTQVMDITTPVALKVVCNGEIYETTIDLINVIDTATGTGSLYFANTSPYTFRWRNENPTSRKQLLVVTDYRESYPYPRYEFIAESADTSIVIPANTLPTGSTYLFYEIYQIRDDIQLNLNNLTPESRINIKNGVSGSLFDSASV